MRKTVAFGFVGTVLDYAGPAVSAGRNGVRHSVYASKNRSHQSTGIVARRPLALAIRNAKRDIASVSPETEVVGVEIERITLGISKRFTPACMISPVVRVSARKRRVFNSHHHRHPRRQICWFLLAEARYLPARLIQFHHRAKKSGPIALAQ